MAHIYKEVYIMLLLQQLWSFYNSFADLGKARKWNGPVIGAITFGSLCGGLFVGNYVKVLTTVNLLLVGALRLIPVVVILVWGYWRCG